MERLAGMNSPEIDKWLRNFRTEMGKGSERRAIDCLSTARRVAARTETVGCKLIGVELFEYLKCAA